MGTTAASRLGSGNTGGMTTPAVTGASGGQQSHTLTSAEQASMPVTTTSIIYGILANSVGSFDIAGGVDTVANVTATGTATGGGGAHNVLNPALAVNYIIKE
jgi:microcystin-dependent protein